MPESIILVGIEGRCFNLMRYAMTPETEAAAGPAAEYIRDKLDGLAKSQKKVTASCRNVVEIRQS